MRNQLSWAAGAIAFLAAFLTAFPTGALAQRYMANGYGTGGRFYLGVQGGVVVPDDVRETLSGSLLGIPVSGIGNDTFDTGATVGFFTGYHFNDWLAGEAQFSWARYDTKDFNARFYVGGSPVGGSVPINGHVTSWTGLADIILTPWVHRSDWSPYVGGGIGFANWDEAINSIGPLYINTSASNTDFAANAVVGVDYALNFDTTLGVRYQFLWVNSGQTTTSGGLTDKIEDAEIHVFTVDIAYHY